MICVASKKLKAQKSEFYFVNSNPVGTCKRENAAGGEWKLPSQPIGMGDRTKEAGAKQFRIEILDLAEFYN